MAFYKDYKDQAWLLPPSISDLIPEDHLCYFLEEVIDSMDFSPMEARYEGPGHPAYHPKIILKLLLIGMTEGIRSSRKIARSARENVVYMYLAGKLKPDFRTISDFRMNNQEMVSHCFKQVVSLAKRLGMVGLGNLSIDGSKFKANASTEQTLTKEELSFIEGFIKNEISKGIREDLIEDERYGEDKDGYETPKDIRALIREKLKEMNLKSRNEKVLRKISRNYLEGNEGKKKKIMERINKAKSQLDQASVSLTDPESRFMKNEKDHTEHSYNPQLTVDSKFGIILANDVVQQCTDVDQLVPQIEKSEESVGKLPEGTKINADNGYYKVENLKYLSDRKLDGYIPSNPTSQKLKGKTIEKNPFGKESFVYDPEKDEFICPNNEKITFRYSCFDKSKKKNFRIYQGSNCRKCKYYEQCVKNKKGVKIIKSLGFEKEMKAMDEKFESEAGREEYKIRAMTVEWVYGDIKQNMGFREFLTRGLNKVETEFNLVSIAHNLKRMWNVLKAEAWSLSNFYANFNTSANLQSLDANYFCYLDL
jgi:transposase